MYTPLRLEPLVTVLHDMASPINTLELTLEHLQIQMLDDAQLLSQKGELLSQLRRSQQTVAKLETLLLRARQQLRQVRDTTIHFSSQLTIVLDQFQLQCQLRAVDMSVDCQTNLQIKGSPLFFDQMLTNVIQNSLDAYGFDPPPEPGRREVVISARKRGPDVELTVQDWAGGLQPEIIDGVFQKTKTTKVNGNGVGLITVRRIVEEQFGGAVEMKSVPKVGTLVRFVF